MSLKPGVFVAGVVAAIGLAAGPAMASTSSGGSSTSQSSQPKSGAQPVQVPVTLRPVVAPVLGAVSSSSAANASSTPSAGNGTTAGTYTGSVASYGGAGNFSSYGAASNDFNPSTGGYTPPLHGTDPHGEGTAFGLTTEPRPTPDTNNCDAPSKNEILVVGRSCGQETSGGSYNGHVTVLALGGQELLGENSTSSGSSATGSLAPLAGPLLSGLNSGLSQVCSGSSQNVCVSLLAANSSTTSSGSTNSFRAASVSLGGSSGIDASVLSSSGTISQTSTCQTATGSSSVADLAAGGTTLASAGNSQDSSTACQNRSQDSQSASSHVLGGAAAPLTSQVVGSGCPAGTPNTPVKLFGQVSPPAQLLAATCNATDSDGAQAAAPYGTNDGLTVVLGGLGIEAPATESLATAPAAAPSTSPASAPAPPAAAPVIAAAAPAAAVSAPARQLPFTGANLLLEALIAAAMLGAGAVLWLASRRRIA